MALSQVTGLCTTPGLFMKQCGATSLAFECAPSWNEYGSNIRQIYLGSILNGAVMITIGIYNLLSYLDALPSPKSTRPSAAVSPSASGSSEPKEKQTTSVPKWATLNMSVYAIGTGLFAWVRTFFHVSRPLLLLAAIHNLCEWGFIVMWYVPNLRDKRQRFFASFCLVWTIMVLVTFLPLLPYGGFLEQVHGLVLDYAIPYTTYKLYYNTDSAVDNETKTMWGWAFFASVAHVLFTILPIIFMNFFALQNETFDIVMSSLLFISAIVTMAAYSQFVKIYDSTWFQTDDAIKPGYIAKNFPQRFCGGLILGVLTLMVPVMAFNFCEVGGGGLVPTSATTEMHVAVLTVKPGSERFWINRFNSEKLVTIARAAKGCVRYEILQNRVKANEFSVFVVWNSHEEFLMFEKNSPLKKVFDKASRKLIVNFDYGEYYKPIDMGQEPTTQNGAIKFDIENTCAAVWAVVGDWNDCNWFVGCNTVSVSGTSRTIFMQDGREFVQNLNGKKDEEMFLDYTEHRPVERRVTVNLTDSRAKCSVVSTVEIMSPDPLKLDAYTKTMHGRNIALLQAQLKA